MVSSEASRPGEDQTSPVGVISDGDPQLAAAVLPVYAMWPQRVVAATLDNAILAGVTWLALGPGFTSPVLTPGSGPAGDTDWPSGPMVLVPIGAVAILLALQGLTGWTPGKLVVGIRVVRERSAGPAGLPTTLVRWALHLLDAILLIGYLRPLWHEKRQTFADTIAHTVVLQEVPRLPRRPRTVVYAAALVTVVLGLGYGCVPMSSGRTAPLAGDATCQLDGGGQALTTGEITLGGTVEIEQDRRLWTVRETRIARPAATISWASSPSARDVGYRVELDARPLSEDGAPVVSRSWDLGTDSETDWSEDGTSTHTRTISPDGDVHVAEVEITDTEGAMAGLGTDLYVTVRLLADDEVVAGCSGSVTD